MPEFPLFWQASQYLEEMLRASYRLLSIDESIYVLTLKKGKSDYPYGVLVSRGEIEKFSGPKAGVADCLEFRSLLQLTLLKIANGGNPEGTILAFEPELAVISDGLVCFGVIDRELLRSGVSFVAETSAHLAVLAFCAAVAEIAESGEYEGVKGNQVLSEIRRDLVSGLSVPSLMAHLDRERFKLANYLNIKVEPRDANFIGLRSFEVEGQLLTSDDRRPINPRNSWSYDHPPSPTAVFCHGPVEGNVKQFAGWLQVDERVVKARNGLGWYVQKVHGRLFHVWFATEKLYAAVNAKCLAEKAAETARNSAKARETP